MNIEPKNRSSYATSHWRDEMKAPARKCGRLVRHDEGEREKKTRICQGLRTCHRKKNQRLLLPPVDGHREDLKTRFFVSMTGRVRKRVTHEKSWGSGVVFFSLSFTWKKKKKRPENASIHLLSKQRMREALCLFAPFAAAASSKKEMFLICCHEKKKWTGKKSVKWALNWMKICFAFSSETSI